MMTRSIHYFRWLSLLSLDAVLVALVWQQFLATVAHVNLLWEERALLGISVWIIYILDHLLDSTTDLAQAARHHFVKKYRLSLSLSIFVAGILDMRLALSVSFQLFFLGCLLAILTLLYLLINRWLIKYRVWPRGREFIIAVIFGLGCGLAPLTDQYNVFLTLGIMTLIFLGAINCILIARLEREVPLKSLTKNLLFSPSKSLIIGCAAIIIGYYYKIPLLTEAFAISFFGLSLIPRVAKKFGYEIASLATDGVLFLGAALPFLYSVLLT